MEGEEEGKEEEEEETPGGYSAYLLNKYKPLLFKCTHTPDLP